MNHLTNKLIEDFLGYLKIDRKCSISSHNQRLAAIHSFFRNMQYEEPASLMHFQQVIALPVKKAPKTSIPHLTPDAMKLLLEQPDKTTLKGRRDLTLLCILYDSGCRVQELADLKVRDVILDTQPVIVLTGKGNKTRRVPIMKNTVLLLEAYIQEHKLDKSWKTDYPLFNNKQHNKLTKEGISYIIMKYVSAARESSQSIPPKVSPHMF